MTTVTTGVERALVFVIFLVAAVAVCWRIAQATRVGMAGLTTCSGNRAIDHQANLGIGVCVAQRELELVVIKPTERVFPNSLGMAIDTSLTQRTLVRLVVIRLVTTPAILRCIFIEQGLVAILALQVDVPA